MCMANTTAPAVEDDLPAAAGEKGSVGVGVFDVVTACGRQEMRCSAKAQRARTRRRAGEHQLTQRNGAGPLISA